MTQCPQAAIEDSWPLICAALVNAGQGSPNSQAAAIATCAIETASTFMPVREAYWLSEDWRRANLRYYPYYGRGFIQLTWDYNYAAAEQALGIHGLKTNPDMAMDPTVAAAVFSWYWASHDIQEPADRWDWTDVRRRVQGGSAGLDRLIQICTALLS